MALQMILGSSGSGKSYRMYQYMIQQSMKRPDENFFILVPEQFTWQTQKEVIEMHPNHGTMNIDMISFHRLSYRVFEELRERPTAILDDIGKNMVIRKLLEEKKKQFKIFGTSADKPGFVDEMKSLLSEFYQYHIGEQQLDDMMEKTPNNTLLYYKLQESKVMLQSFEQFIGEHYIVAEQLLDLLATKVEKSNLLKDSTILIDGFTGFTPVQYTLLGQLMKVAKHIFITVTIDPREQFFEEIKEYELFAMSKRTIRKVKEVAKENGIEIRKDAVIHSEVSYRFLQNEELAHLEHELFRYPFRAYEKKVDRIHISIYQNPKMEALFVARKIEQIVREKNISYRDIAVVTGDQARYESALEHAFSRLHIPYFMDSTKSVLNNHLIESIRALLSMIEYDFSYNTVFRYLKAGLSSVSSLEADKLDSYVMATGIRGFSAWKKPFTRKPRSYEEEEVKQLDEIRKKFIQEVETIREKLKKDATLEEKMVALYEFFDEMDYEKKIKKEQLSFEERGEKVLAKIYDQVFEAVISLMERLVEILGNDHVSIRELEKMLDVGWKELKLGVIPPGLDQIVVGDIERTRLKNIKVLFFVGINEGIIPKSAQGHGVLSDMERERLKEGQLELAPTTREEAYIQQFYLYLNMTKPSDYMYLSLSKIDLDGKTIRPSFLIHRIKQIFPRISVLDESQTKTYPILTREDSFEYMMEGFENYLAGNKDKTWEAMADIFSESTKGKLQLERMILSIFYYNQELPLSKAVARALYGVTMRNSVTRLERYAGCAFAHFLRYGLALQERSQFKIYSVDIGNVLHKTMELFSKNIASSKEYDWKTITDEQRDLLAKQCVQKAVEEYDLDVLKDCARNRYMMHTFERIAKRTLWALQSHIKLGDFEPYAFEFNFQTRKDLDCVTLKLQDGAKMELSGVIDRIDRYESDDAIYLKVVDYKSGNTSFEMFDLYYGLQIQLLAYMNVALELQQKETDKKVVPAGVFYYNMKDPIIDHTKSKDLQEELLKRMKMSGLVNQEKELIAHLENSEKPISIPVSFTKNGELSKTSSAVDTDQFLEIGNYVKDEMVHMGNEILNGNVAISPCKSAKRDACQYCEYLDVCDFDVKLKENNYRQFSDLKKEQILELIHKKEAGDLETQNPTGPASKETKNEHLKTKHLEEKTAKEKRTKKEKSGDKLSDKKEEGGEIDGMDETATTNY